MHVSFRRILFFFFFKQLSPVLFFSVVVPQRNASSEGHFWHPTHLNFFFKGRPCFGDCHLQTNGLVIQSSFQKFQDFGQSLTLMTSWIVSRQETVAMFRSHPLVIPRKEVTCLSTVFYFCRTLRNKKGDLSSVSRLKAKVLQIIFLLLHWNKPLRNKCFVLNDCLAVSAIPAT